MKEPLVSVFMPTFNHVEFIDDAIRSSVEQDYPNLQVVVGDDGSTDGTRERVAEWVKRYPGRVVATEGPHLGMVGNCNRVLQECRGQYVAMTSGDDLFLPGKIARQVAWMEEGEGRILCGHAIEAFDSATGATVYRSNDTMKLSQGRGAARYVSKMALFPGISLFIRASAIPSVGYDERVGIVSDFKFLADVLSSGGEYGYVDGLYGRYRVHRQSLSQRSRTEEQVARQYLEGFLIAFALLEAGHPPLLAACSEGRARVVFGEARRLQRIGEVRAARAYYRKALKELAPSVMAKAIGGLTLTYAPPAVVGWMERLLMTVRRS